MSGLSAFRDKRVLVTGHTGFKGGWLCRVLEHLGAQVTGFSLPPPTTPSLFDDARIDETLESVIGDLRDLARVQAVFAQCSPEVVFHLAAQPLVRAAFERPVETFATNVLGTAHVLEAVRECSATRAVVVATTDKVYQNKEWIWGYREADPLGGDEPYSASKAGTEFVVTAYRSSYLGQRSPSCGVATARAGNVVGGGDWAIDRIVPDIVRAAAARTGVEIRNPGSTRPWQHVLDPVFGYLTLASALLDDPGGFGEAWNFGPFSEGVRTVWDLAEKLGRALGTPVVNASTRPSGPKEAASLVLDSSKAVYRLGWRPRFDFEEALDLTATWYAQWLNKPSSSRSAMDEQIAFALTRIQ